MAEIPNTLTPLQRRFLDAFSKTELTKDFFLTGGTALAHFYLQHRLSEDLDFFAEVPGAVTRVHPILDSIANALSGSLKVRREYETFTQKKHVGLDEYWLARALENVSLVEKLPRMLKPLDVPTLQDFFNEQIARLMKIVEKKS